MAEEYNDQRPVVIAAIVVAALVAIGLWYFFVFRTPETPEFVVETPTPLAEEQNETSAPLSPTDTPLSAEMTPNPVVAPIEPTAPTGPAETTLILSLIITAAGLLGLRKIQAQRA